MPNTVVPNCFRKAGFGFGDVTDDEEYVPLKELRVILMRLKMDEISAEEYVSCDNDVLTENNIDFELNAISGAIDENNDENHNKNNKQQRR